MLHNIFGMSIRKTQIEECFWERLSRFYVISAMLPTEPTSLVDVLVCNWKRSPLSSFTIKVNGYARSQLSDFEANNPYLR